jgi:hypothetical protein
LAQSSLTAALINSDPELLFHLFACLVRALVPLAIALYFCNQRCKNSKTFSSSR